MSEKEAEDTPDSERTPDDESRPWWQLVLLLVAVLAVASVAAYTLGVAPSPGGNRTSTPSGGAGDSPTATPQSTTAPSGASQTDVAFSFVIDDIQQCGSRCRDVTVTLTNTGTKPATNTQVSTRIFTNQRKVWQGQSSLGTVAPDDPVTRTRRVKIGYVDAARIKANDGYIRIETTVTWDGGSTTFTDRRKVA